MSDTAKDILLTDEEMEAFLEQRFGVNNLANRQYFMDVAKAQLLKAADWIGEQGHDLFTDAPTRGRIIKLLREAAETDSEAGLRYA